MSRYCKEDLYIGQIVYASLSSENRLGYITRISESPGVNTVCIDNKPTYIDDIEIIVTQEWYENEMQKTFPLLSWSIGEKDKLKGMMERLANKGLPPFEVKQEKKEWIGLTYPSGFAWTGD